MATKKQNIMDRVKTFADACEVCGIDQAAWEDQHKDLDLDMQTYARLRVVVQALNEGWKPEFSEKERRWYPWYVLYTKKEIEKMDQERRAKLWRFGGNSNNGADCGLVCAGSNGVWSSSSANVSARLAYRTSELAEYAGRQFVELYAIHYTGTEVQPYSDEALKAMR